MAFSQFEKCASLQGVHLDEDRILDLFDEAIRETEAILGEDTDTVSPEGFALVARQHNLIRCRSTASS